MSSAVYLSTPKILVSANGLACQAFSPLSAPLKMVPTYRDKTAGPNKVDQVSVIVCKYQKFYNGLAGFKILVLLFLLSYKHHAAVQRGRGKSDFIVKRVFLHARQ